ncbi:hypothetical protein [Mycobacterium sp.]|uniref:hypothetical protein n=1 Tax=Mycobacterium sp. TaxID=1785 RepID=UPI002D9ACE49|nr:hypothetical protein [Mycobacterium sp.]
MIGLVTEFTVTAVGATVRSNSRRAKASRPHTAGVCAGEPGVVPAANGLRTMSIKLETGPGTTSTGVLTAAAVATAAGCERLSSAAVGILADVDTGMAAASNAMSVISAVACNASSTTLVASTRLIGAGVGSAGAFAADKLLVVFADLESDAVDSVVGRAGAVASAIVDPPPDSVVSPVDSVGPPVSDAYPAPGVSPASGAGTRGVSGVGSNSPAVVTAASADGTEPVFESACARTVRTAPASAVSVAGCVDVDEFAVLDPVPVPAVAPPGDDDEDEEAVDPVEPVDDESDPVVSAVAAPHPHPVTTAAPTPKATANPPTRPTYAAALIVEPAFS